MKRIVSVGISMGTALALMLSGGVTASAGHHTPCMTRVIQGSGLCLYGESHSGRHHLFGHDGWRDCGVCGVDVGAVCDSWEDCHNRYGAGTACPWQGTDAVPESQPSAGAVPESQPVADQTEGNQPQAQTESKTGAAGTGAYGSGAGYQNYNNACYGGGGHCWSGSYSTGHHGSGHHGHGHH